MEFSIQFHEPGRIVLPGNLEICVVVRIEQGGHEVVGQIIKLQMVIAELVPSGA